MGKLGFEIANKTAEESQKKGARYNYLKVVPNNPPKQIRFDTVDGDANSILTYAEHYVKFHNGWSKSFSCPDFMNEDVATCEICKAKSGKTGDIAQNQLGNKFLMQVIERDAKDPDPETKKIPEDGVDTVKAFKFSPFLWTTLLAYYKENETLGDRDYMISMVKTTANGKDKIAYVVEPVTAEAKALTKADKVLLAEKPNLVDIEPPYDIIEFNRLKDMQSGDAESPVNVKDTINSFLGGADELSTLPTVKSPVAASDDDDDDNDEAEFFKTLKKHN
jgi:hypothetical protein